MNAQTNATGTLSAQQQSVASIAALAAVGDIHHLKSQLIMGLDAGLTINETKEILVQLYAYCGFPRSLNAINAFMSVLEERKSRGKKDVEGKDASPITDNIDRYETGKKNLQTLTKREDIGPKTGANAFAPIIDTFLKEHLFADIFNRDILSYQQRELATISALAAMTGTEGQLQAHLGMGINTGLNKKELLDIFSIVEKHVSVQQAEIGRKVLEKVVATTQGN